jgi:hypothetical protein
MQSPAHIAPNSSFAGLLATLTEPGWNDDALEDDVATLSYERALRTHARYKSADPTDRSLTQAADPAPSHFDEVFAASADRAAEIPRPAPVSAAGAESGTVPNRSAVFDRNLKNASITIRLSQGECAQLKSRAAEAGITVSAYLRSCTFEAESLRAQVKETLAQLRAASSSPRRFRFGRLLPFLQR